MNEDPRSRCLGKEMQIGIGNTRQLRLICIDYLM
ncbi:hypothetical protein T12_8964 [Trichinella patagoniensis]|uniref:Uncharacterized protein n=1 Tax=Trichinella patagoniensis TaxID=990121 RepID=A0A0V0W072_9BILA|nr:hypothetical protein T12_8964 [Trichinella patagoniensis]